MDTRYSLLSQDIAGKEDELYAEETEEETEVSTTVS